MSYLETDWTEIARTLGLTTEEEMLKHLYEDQAWSIMEISKLVGYSTFVVRKRLLRMGLVMRGRGGAVRTGVRKLSGLSDAELFNVPTLRLAEKHNVNQTTVYLERQLRKKLKGEQDELLRNSTTSGKATAAGA